LGYLQRSAHFWLVSFSQTASFDINFKAISNHSKVFYLVFFITVGAGINFSILFGNPLLILGQTLGLMIIKAGILFALSLLFKIKGRSRWLFTLSLT